MSDDGEPSGTAGRPILAVLSGSGLGDCTVVVTRYSGGTKLGTGGLVKAYTEAAQLSLLELEVTEKVAMTEIEVRDLDYQVYSRVKGPIEALGCELKNEEFGAAVNLSLLVNEEKAGEVERMLQEASNGQANVSRVDKAEEVTS
eukprot:CAMPEP_0184304386 /NCGR_PEP_ID=MMETSP1049-20130417/13916_1 /TAXON_ID=77928 /ORGANISM="Proteomonas sulcata, Strain CCMP704" /LENGTH=143 /DNA_ID=CAMNT_0026616181 /DNA_START=103 /DNA_END=534 /DNA_ORIENTATION=-